VKELLTFSTKAKIRVGFIVLAIMVGFGGCDNGTSPIPQSHPDNIGYINVNGRNIDIRASFAITPEQEADLLERLTEALNSVPVTENVNFQHLRIIEITGLGSGSGEAIAGGIIRGVAIDGGTLIGWLMVPLTGEKASQWQSY